MESLYKPAGVESRWQETWEAEGLYAAGAGATRDESYVICVPPPNVTGELHMGHALNGSIQDVLVRWHRMRGYRTLWQPGYDHAGIATQNVVEKQLAPGGLTRHDLGREAFVERTWEWLEQTGRTIMGQYRRLGASLDYGRERFTMDEGYVAGGDDVLRSALGAGLDLPREPDRQLVPVPPDGDLRPRGRARRHGRRAHLRPLPVRGRRRSRRHRDRDGATGDDSRRRRRRRAPGRPALSRRGRPRGRRPVRRAARAGDRGRARRSGVRHGRAQDHARPRSAGLRDRPRPRAARADGDRARRPDERRRPATSRA